MGKLAHGPVPQNVHPIAHLVKLCPQNEQVLSKSKTDLKLQLLWIFCHFKIWWALADCSCSDSRSAPRQLTDCPSALSLEAARIQNKKKDVSSKQGVLPSHPARPIYTQIVGQRLHWVAFLLYSLPLKCQGTSYIALMRRWVSYGARWWANKASTTVEAYRHKQNRLALPTTFTLWYGAGWVEKARSCKRLPQFVMSMYCNSELITLFGSHIIHLWESAASD